MGCEAQQAWNAYSRPDRRMRGELFFDVQLGFASGSVRARLQVFVYSDYDLCYPGCPKIDSYILTPCDPEK